MFNGAMQLKTEGNKLVTGQKWKEAQAKYERAIDNLSGLRGPRSDLLRTQCQLNSALCYLKTEDWSMCVQECSSVLAKDPGNLKALMRRGKARIRMGDYGKAVSDLRKAQRELSEDEALASDLAEALRKLEEKGEAPPPEEEEDEGEVEELVTPAAAASAAGLSGAGSVPPPRPDQASMAAMAAQNPGLAKTTMEMLGNMTQEQLDDFVRASGQQLPGGQKLTPEMARAMAQQFSSMTPEQMESYSRMAQAMAAGGAGAAGPGTAGPGAPSTSGQPGAPGAPQDMAGMAQRMLSDPAMRKMAIASLKGMTPQQLRAMSGPLGHNMSDSQIASMLSTMQSMDEAQLEKFMSFAGSAASALAWAKKRAVPLAAAAVLLLGLCAWLVRRWWAGRGGAAAPAPPPVSAGSWGSTFSFDSSEM